MGMEKPISLSVLPMPRRADLVAPVPPTSIRVPPVYSFSGKKGPPPVTTSVIRWLVPETWTGMEKPILLSVPIGPIRAGVTTPVRPIFIRAPTVHSFSRKMAPSEVSPSVTSWVIRWPGLET